MLNLLLGGYKYQVTAGYFTPDWGCLWSQTDWVGRVAPALEKVAVPNAADVSAHIPGTRGLHRVEWRGPTVDWCTKESGNPWAFEMLLMYSPALPDLMKLGVMPQSVVLISRLHFKDVPSKLRYNQVLVHAQKVTTDDSNGARLMNELRPGLVLTSAQRVQDLSVFETFIAQRMDYRGMQDHPDIDAQKMKGKWTRPSPSC